MLLSLYSYFRFCFRFIQTYLSIIQEHSHAYSEPCVSLAHSEPWHIPITNHIQISRHIHDTILNIFTKAPSQTLDTVLNAPLFYRCQSNFMASLTLYFRHILAYPRLIQPYLFFLRDIFLLRTFFFSHTQAYYQRYTYYVGRFKVIQNPSLFKHVMFQVYSDIFTTLDIRRDICPHSSIFRQIQAYSESWHYRFK